MFYLFEAIETSICSVCQSMHSLFTQFHLFILISREVTCTHCPPRTLSTHAFSSSSMSCYSHPPWWHSLWQPLRHCWPKVDGLCPCRRVIRKKKKNQATLWLTSP